MASFTLLLAFLLLPQQNIRIFFHPDNQLYGMNLEQAKSKLLESCKTCQLVSDREGADLIAKSESRSRSFVIFMYEKKDAIVDSTISGSWADAWSNIGKSVERNWAEFLNTQERIRNEEAEKKSNLLRMERELEEIKNGKVPLVSRFDGGSMQTNLIGSITLNRGTKLSREWIVIHDPKLPVNILGPCGVSVSFVKEYLYHVGYSIWVKDPVSAVELRFILFNVWGSPMGVLRSFQVKDLAGGEAKYSDNWHLNETEASEFYASIAYISRVRTASGVVIEADTSLVMEEARKFWKKFTPENLESYKAGIILEALHDF